MEFNQTAYVILAEQEPMEREIALIAAYTSNLVEIIARAAWQLGGSHPRQLARLRCRPFQVGFPSVIGVGCTQLDSSDYNAFCAGGEAWQRQRGLEAFRHLHGNPAIGHHLRVGPRADQERRKHHECERG